MTGMVLGSPDSKLSPIAVGKGSFCGDKNAFCATWAASGACKENTEFMQRNCGLSCGVCRGTPFLERMPLIGWGTCCRSSATGEPLKTSMREYLRMGGRLIDTAIMYSNHRDIAAVLEEPEFQTLKREDIFVTSKIPPLAFRSGEKETKASMSRILKELNVGYIDLVLLHAPGSRAQNIAAWKVLESELRAGRAMAIGVSNFEVEHLENLVEDGATVTPMNNQISMHPGQKQREILQYCKEHRISVTAYNSIKGMNSVSTPTLESISAAHNKSKAQILLRWGVDHGVSVIPGCTSPEHIREALDVIDFGPLSRSELEALGQTVAMHSVEV